MSWYTPRVNSLNNYYCGTPGLNYSFNTTCNNKEDIQKKKKEPIKERKRKADDNYVSPTTSTNKTTKTEKKR